MKKHAFHPKSYPVPPQLAASRNPHAPAPAKAGTLQAIPAMPKSTVSRPTKSPSGGVKKLLEPPSHPKLMISKQAQRANKPRSINLEKDKSLKKSLSNNDIHILPGKSAGSPKLTHQPCVKVPEKKHHSPSPLPVHKSPSPTRTQGSKFAQPSKSAPSQKAGSGTKPNTAKAKPAPWPDVVYKQF